MLLFVAATFLLAAFSGSFGKPSGAPINGKLFEEDILLTAEQQAGLNLRNAVLNSKRWQQNRIPYIIDSDRITSDSDRNLILSGIAFYNNATCIRWVPRATELSYVNITRFGSGCYSYVGQVSFVSQQLLHLERGCMRFGTVVHEMMHAVGFFHEQSRPDRDGYVDILTENITPGTLHNFNKYDTNTVSTLNSPYDYGSVMHYGTTSFSKNGKPTIVPRKPGATIGQRSGLSTIDLYKVNKLYNCNDNIAGVTFDPNQFNTFPPLSTTSPVTVATTPPPVFGLPYHCTFDTDKCSFTDGRGVFTWTRNRGETPSPGTGPTQSVTGPTGYYMFTEASGRLPNDDAHLLSPSVVFNGPACLSFYYHMTGMSVGRLSVRVVYGNDMRELFTRSGDQGTQWVKARANIILFQSAKIDFVGFIGSGFSSDIAIDDVSITNGTCTVN